MPRYDETHPPPPKLPWWQLAIMWIVGWFIVLPVMFLGTMWVLGMMMDGTAQYNSARDYCRKHADTPNEYHKC